MKKLVPLVALLAATSVSAGDFDTVDVELSATAGDWTLEHVVDGTDIKVKRDFSLLGSETSDGIPMSVSWSAEDGISTVETSAGIDVFGLGLKETVKWSEGGEWSTKVEVEYSIFDLGLKETFSWSEGGEWATEVEAKYSMLGVEMTVKPSFDLDEMEYSGIKLGASYDVALGDRLTVTPEITAPWDENGDRSDISLKFKVSVSF